MANKPAVVLSFDLELAWGACDVAPLPALIQDAQATHRRAAPALLEWLREFELPATWAVVGALCERELPPCVETWAQAPRAIEPLVFFGQASGEREVWFAPEFIERIASSPGQEVAFHGYSHVSLADGRVPFERVEQELARCRTLAGQLGVTAPSFVFPRNRVGALESLLRHGFQCFRAPDRLPVRALGNQSRRWASLFSDFLALPPRMSAPTWAMSTAVGDGLVALPGSLMMRSFAGWRKSLRKSVRTRRLDRGVRRCIQEEGIFHVWLHPIDLVRGPELTEVVRTFLSQLASARELGQIQILTMAQVNANFREGSRAPLKAGRG